MFVSLSLPWILAELELYNTISTFSAELSTVFLKNSQDLNQCGMRVGSPAKVLPFFACLRKFFSWNIFTCLGKIIHPLRNKAKFSWPVIAWLTCWWHWHVGIPATMFMFFYTTSTQLTQTLQHRKQMRRLANSPMRQIHPWSRSIAPSTSNTLSCYRVIFSWSFVNLFLQTVSVKRGK